MVGARQKRDDLCGDWKRRAVRMKKEEKTNVMRVLDGRKIPYESHLYEPDATMSGEEIAGILGENPEKVFKTLVTQGKSGAKIYGVEPGAESIFTTVAGVLVPHLSTPTAVNIVPVFTGMTSQYMLSDNLG